MNSPEDKRAHSRYACAIGTLLALGLIWSAYVFATAHAPPGTSLKTWLDGSAGRQMDRELRLPGLARVDTAIAALRYRLFGDLGPHVVQGCPGWLFYRDGMHATASKSDPAFAQRLRLMRAWQDKLRSRGVKLLVVVVPDKSRIQQPQLCGASFSIAMRDRLDAWEAALKEADVRYADLRRPLLDVHTAFFRTDVHMNGRGAAAAAQAVAHNALAILGSTGTQRYSAIRVQPPQPRVGDLIVLAGLADAPDLWRPAPDMERVEDIQPIRTGGLLDDTPPVEVMLAGSSNGRRSLFAERLGKLLGREIWNRSQDGGQFAGALMTALHTDTDWPASLKLVIWEFSEMALSLPLTPAETSAIAELDKHHAL